MRKDQIKPSDLLHELQQGERITEDVKAFLRSLHLHLHSHSGYITGSIDASTITATTVVPGNVTGGSYGGY